MASRFSIIVPVYNVAPYLHACLDSVLAQTCGDWECVCVDDGSSDGSGKILDEYSVRDSRFRVIHQTNAGVSAARNAALEAASGEWVCFLDGDDAWNGDFLKVCSGIIAHDDAVDMVGFGMCRSASTFSFAPDAVSDIARFSGDAVLAAFTPYFWSRIYRRSLLKGVRFHDYTVGEDILFQTEALVRARLVLVSDAVLYGYRERMGSAIRSPLTERKVTDQIGYLSEVIRLLSRCGKSVPAPLRRICANGLTEGFADAYFRLERSARGRVRAMWRQKVDADSLPGGFQRFRFRILQCLPFDVGMRLLCVLPYWLKTHGLRRCP